MNTLGTSPAYRISTPASDTEPTGDDTAAQIAALLASLWATRPSSRSPMQTFEAYQRSGKKYVRQTGAPTDALLLAHARGTATFAAPLLGPDERARALCIDIDKGGAEAMRSALEAAAVCGVTAFALLHTTPGGHSGGHLWALLAQDVAGDRALALARQICRAAQLPEKTECFPTAGDIRLPFGVHRWTGQRGQLLLPTGEIFDLDSADGLAAAVGEVLALPRNAAGLCPLPAPEAPRQAGPLGVQLGAGESPIARFNAGATVDQVVNMLERRPGYGVKRERGDGVLMHCGCGQHDSAPNPAVLRVYRGRNGRVQVASYSSDCRWYTGKGRCFDAFAVYCEVEGLSPKDAAAQLQPAREQRTTGGPPARTPPPPTDRDRRTPAATPVQNLDGPTPARHVPPLRPPNPSPGTPLPLSPLAPLNPSAKGAPRVLAAIAALAKPSGDCLASRAQIAEFAGFCERHVKRLLRRLEREGAIDAFPRYGQTTIYRIREREAAGGGHVCAAVGGDESPTWNLDSITCSESIACEGGAAPRARAVLPPAAEFDEAAWFGLLEQTAPADLAPPDWEPDWATDVDELGRVANGHTAEPAPAILEQFEHVPSASAASPICEPFADQPAALAIAAEATHICDGVAGTPIRFEGGAAFDPAAAAPVTGSYTGRSKDLLSTRELLEGLRALYDLAAMQRPDPAPAAVVELGLPVVEAPTRRGPPRSPERRQQYWKLLGKARKASSDKQRRWLRGQAAALEEWYSEAEWAAQQALERRSAERAATLSPKAAASSAQLDFLADALADPKSGTGAGFGPGWAPPQHPAPAAAEGGHRAGELPPLTSSWAAEPARASGEGRGALGEGTAAADFQRNLVAAVEDALRTGESSMDRWRRQQAQGGSAAATVWAD